ncbi:hypothetical protein PVAG01_07703 [Phlyctema vagabunda]|uniref:Uncharacterized protein n=1 Tax=Phlyctema vagabunda TaxID=108571 RepID=A0ABR4PD56_9HELO
MHSDREWSEGTVNHNHATCSGATSAPSPVPLFDFLRLAIPT